MSDEEKDEIKGPDFVIVDRRAREPETGEEAAPEAGKPPETAPEEKAEAEPEQAREPAEEAAEGEALEVADVYGTIAFVISLLHQQAWALMGLVPHPVTKEYTKDFEQAQLAIDCVAFLVGKLSGKVPDDEMNRLRALVSDLQLNFARQKAPG
jgi:hypothetical protein